MMCLNPESFVRCMGLLSMVWPKLTGTSMTTFERSILSFQTILTFLFKLWQLNERAHGPISGGKRGCFYDHN